jgi:hypothetical protein
VRSSSRAQIRECGFTNATPSGLPLAVHSSTCSPAANCFSGVAVVSISLL